MCRAQQAQGRSLTRTVPGKRRCTHDGHNYQFAARQTPSQTRSQPRGARRPNWPRRNMWPTESHSPCTLCIAATNHLAQDRIGERRCQRLAVGEEYRFTQNSPEARQPITLVGPVDMICLTVPRHIGKDLIKIDPGRGCRCGRKRLERDARTDTNGNDNCDR
jgi:hypothetical protein